MVEQGFSMRVGSGYDVHKLVPDRKMMLCGVEVPYQLGLLGHSDADVALHALMDAMLGALALGDIGHLFPDTDARFKNISSMRLLDEVMQLVTGKGWVVGNVDVTVIAQAPKLAPYVEEMRSKLAQALNVALECVSVKATTTEHLGFTGRGEGIAAEAVVLLGKR